MLSLLFLLGCPVAMADPLTDPETSYYGASILEGDSEVMFDEVLNLDQELDPDTYAFFEGSTLYVGNSDDYGNSIDGIIFYLIPDFSQINLTVVGNALGQAFFSLSLGMGMLITYGSYVDSKNNIINSAALITLTDVGIAFLSGLIIFPFVFSSGIETEGGPGLIFQVFPKIFQNLGDVTGVIVGSTFFILLSFAR